MQGKENMSAEHIVITCWRRRLQQLAALLKGNPMQFIAVRLENWSQEDCAADEMKDEQNAPLSFSIVVSHHHIGICCVFFPLWTLWAAFSRRPKIPIEKWKEKLRMFHIWTSSQLCVPFGSFKQKKKKFKFNFASKTTATACVANWNMRICAFLSFPLNLFTLVPLTTASFFNQSDARIQSSPDIAPCCCSPCIFVPLFRLVCSRVGLHYITAVAAAAALAYPLLSLAKATSSPLCTSIVWN